MNSLAPIEHATVPKKADAANGQTAHSRKIMILDKIRYRQNDDDGRWTMVKGRGRVENELTVSA